MIIIHAISDNVFTNNTISILSNKSFGIIEHKIVFLSYYKHATEMRL